MAILTYETIIVIAITQVLNGIFNTIGLYLASRYIIKNADKITKIIKSLKNDKN